MNGYGSALALRQSIDDRLRKGARAGVDPMLIRNRIVCERVLARLVAARRSSWVLKGGIALKARFGDRARETRDLDLALTAHGPEARDVRALVGESLTTDPDEDWFSPMLVQEREITPAEAGRPGWRFTVRADLAGREFSSVHLDVVLRDEEITATDRVRIQSLLSFAEIPDIEVEAVTREQHFAEKLHAYTSTFAGRENTRVKDLVDLVLLIETELRPTRKLRSVVELVFRVRGTHAVPSQLRPPPVSWTATFAGMATEIGLRTRTLGQAAEDLQAFWDRVPAARSCQARRS